MNSSERWFLEVAVELTQPLRALTSAKLETWFNRQHHGLDTVGVVDVLRKLLRQKLIVLSAGRDGVLRPPAEELRRLREVPDERRLHSGAYYGLTAAGGAAWEAVACPDWSRFIDASYGSEPDEGEVVCADPARAEWYAFSPHNSMRAVPGSVRRDVLEPWRATYWKTLPRGHRLIFRYQWREGGPACSRTRARQELAWHDEANRWYTPEAGPTQAGPA